LAAFALTEPNGGSNPTDLKTRAAYVESAKDSGYRITDGK
jgi:alkylation response protein AidB-like acyl-CoA dehydrogenase